MDLPRNAPFQRLCLMLSLIISAAQGQSSSTSGDVPLAQKRFPWPNLPYKADTGVGERGPQSGEMVAYCTTKSHGARLLTTGAIKGIQLTRTPGYIQVVGYIDQTALNVKAGDSGGEADPHGADLRGNPLGGLVYSSTFNQPGATGFTQVIEWNYFVGNNIFCLKACDPAGADAAKLCEHIYDRIGCEYNMPADYKNINGTFQACKGDNQLPVGQYVENGVMKTWRQPPESEGPIKVVPYKPQIPASSECITYASTALFTELAGAPQAQPTPAPGSFTGANVTRNSTVPSTNSTQGPNNPAFPAPTSRRTAGTNRLSTSWSEAMMIILPSTCIAIGAMLTR